MTEDRNLWEDDELLDRLVDGELPRDEYEQLLRSFEQHPEGWRRCALAFLESQAWQRELSVIRDIPATVSLPEADPSVGGACQPAKADRAKASFNWIPILAVAATFLIAFALGLRFRGSVLSSGAGLVPNDLVENSGEPNSETMPEQPIVSGAGLSANAVPDNVMLVVDPGDGSNGQPIEVPVIDWSPEHERMLTEPSISIPPEVQRMLRGLGHEFQSRRQVVPLRLEDGRQILVPVEQLEITPVRVPRYQ